MAVFTQESALSVLTLALLIEVGPISLYLLWWTLILRYLTFEHGSDHLQSLTIVRSEPAQPLT